MAVPNFNKFFPPGRGLQDGNHLNKLFTGQEALQAIVIQSGGSITNNGSETTAGTATFNGATIQNGSQTAPPVTIAAAGATQGTATQISTTAYNVRVTVTASTEGVKLPAIVVGKSIIIWPPPTKGLKVYSGVAGQVINANTTATTAFPIVSAKPAEFYAVTATVWQCIKGS